jgi:hypothetical protein
VDLGIALDKIRPGAKYRAYDTYENLVNTWEDETPCPTLEELEAEWNNIINPILTTEQKIQAIEEKYKPKFDSFEKSITRIMLADGSNQGIKIEEIQNQYKVMSDQMDLEITEVLLNV